MGHGPMHAVVMCRSLLAAGVVMHQPAHASEAMAVAPADHLATVAAVDDTGLAAGARAIRRRGSRGVPVAGRRAAGAHERRRPGRKLVSAPVWLHRHPASGGQPPCEVAGQAGKHAVLVAHRHGPASATRGERGTRARMIHLVAPVHPRSASLRRGGSLYSAKATKVGRGHPGLRGTPAFAEAPRGRIALK